MKKTLNLLNMLLILLSMIACSNSNFEPEEIEATGFFLTKHDCTWGNDKIGIGKMRIINDLDGFQSYMPCNDAIQYFDFTKYSLLLVRGKSYYGIDYVGSEFLKTGNNSYSLTVLMHDALIAVITDYYIPIQVPKITSNSKINLSIKSIIP